MQISYQNSKMIVTHPSGVISEYTRDNLEDFKIDIESDIANLNGKKTNVESQQAQIDAAAGSL